MNKKFMSAELQAGQNGCLALHSKMECDLWPRNIPMPKEPHDWREAARSAATYENADLKDSDLIDVKAYMTFKIRTDVFFEDNIILDSIKLDQNLPEGYAVIGTSDGYPLLVCWEEDWSS